MRRLESCFLLACLPLVLAVGCNRELSNAELGKCLWAIPAVQGAEGQYTLPEPPKSAVPDPYEQELKSRRAKNAASPKLKTKTIPPIDLQSPQKD